MLSFLQEQEQECANPPATEQPAVSNQSDADNSKCAVEQEYFTVADKKKNLHKSTMLLIALFAIGLLCLGVMIKKSAPQTAASQSSGISKEEAEIEAAIARLTGVGSEMFNRLDEIVNKFYEFSDVQQIKLDELVKNPFRYEAFLGGLAEQANTEDQRRWQQKDGVQLLSIMRTESGNCCMINDKILREGDSIGAFKVCQIGDNFVKLEQGGTETVLKLSE